MWGFAEVLGKFFTVLRVYGPILRHSHDDNDGGMDYHASLAHSSLLPSPYFPSLCTSLPVTFLMLPT